MGSRAVEPAGTGPRTEGPVRPRTRSDGRPAASAGGGGTLRPVPGRAVLTNPARQRPGRATAREPGLTGKRGIAGERTLTGHGGIARAAFRWRPGRLAAGARGSARASLALLIHVFEGSVLFSSGMVLAELSRLLVSAWRRTVLTGPRRPSEPLG